MAHYLDEQTSPRWKPVLIDKMVLNLERLSSCVEIIVSEGYDGLGEDYEM
jgi:hypothetical protein